MAPRTSLCLLLALVFLTAPALSPGQDLKKAYRIGYLGIGTPPAPANATPQQCLVQGIPRGTWQAFMEGLREYGYVPGQNLVIDCRWTEGRAEPAPALAAELVSLKPDLIVVAGSLAGIRATKQATSTIPVVMVAVTDPVRWGLVASLAHPGANVTGLTDTVGNAPVGKRLQLLKEAAPKISRVATLGYLMPGGACTEREAEVCAWRDAEARELGLTLQYYGVKAPEELPGVFAAMTKAHADALFVGDWTFLVMHAKRIVDLAAESRLPAVYHARWYVQAGGLMSFGVDYHAVWRRVGLYVDRILRGAKPADVPVEQPTRFELVINLKSARALGLTLPPSLLSRADEIIE